MIKSKRQYGIDIHNHGMWEEFYQNQGNRYMQSYHFNRRMELIKEKELHYPPGTGHENAGKKINSSPTLICTECQS